MHPATDEPTAASRREGIDLGTLPAGWADLWRVMRSVPRLATANPNATGFMLHRAREAGTDPEPGLDGWVPLAGVSPYVVCAVVKAEDPGFFRHRGIAWAFLRRAVTDALKGQRLRGASTITQQLARNLYLHPVRSYSRKAREAIIARRLEQMLGKPRILELYLNVVEWGSGVWGIGAASRHYFGRPPGDLGAFEAIVLASILPAPRLPLQGRNAERATVLQRRVVHQMFRAGILPPPEARWAAYRVGVLQKMLASGLPLHDALRRIDGIPPPELPAREPLTMQGVLASHCGYDQDMRLKRQEMEAYRRSQAQNKAQAQQTPAGRP